MLPYAKGAEQNYEEEPYDYNLAKEVKWYHYVLLNRPLKVVLTWLALAVITPLLIYNFLFLKTVTFPPSDGYSMGSCLLTRTARLPCGLEKVNNTECHSQCCYDINNNICFHRFPSRFSYILDTAWSEGTILQPRVSTVPFKNQKSLPTLKVSFDEISSTHLILEIYNPEMNTNRTTVNRIEEKEYVYHVASPELDITINRTDGTRIFSTVKGPVIASDNIWEVAIKLTEEVMFGLGEIPLEAETVKVIYSNKKGLSSIPLIYAKANNSYHGLLIDVKEPTEIIIRGENQILIRSITKYGLKFHVFTGPYPSDIMRNVTDLIGSNEDFEYWTLGAHICSETSDTPATAITDITEFLKEAKSANVPFDSHCGPMPLIFHDNFCKGIDASIQRGATLIKNAGKKFMPHLYPYIHYDIEDEITTTELLEKSTDFATEEAEPTTTTDPPTTTVKEICTISEEYPNALLRNNANEIYIGKVGNNTVIYPNFKQIGEEYLDKYLNPNIILNGFMLLDNWPLDESEKTHTDAYEKLPYFSKNFEEAFDNTPLWNIKNSDGEDYIYKHNEYGNNFAEFVKNTHRELPIFSASQWMNGNLPVNRQNVDTLWANLRDELVEASLGGISGHRLWSSPVCGDTESYNTTTQESLCVKWYMTATYMPLIKIHYKAVRRDPLSFTGNNRQIIITALQRRSSLLPYFYTTLQQGPLLRPMFYQFPHSEKLLSLKTQFAVGDSLFIAPNLQPVQSHVHFIRPPGTWYELWSGLPIEGEEGQTVTMTTTPSDFLAFIRGGSIVVLQKDVELQAEETRQKSSFTVKIALECEKNIETSRKASKIDSEDVISQCEAKGSLYVTKSLTLLFEANSTNLVIKSKGEEFTVLCDQENRIWANVLQDIIIYGLEYKHNNFDNYRSITVSKNLCELETSEKIDITLV